MLVRYSRGALNAIISELVREEAHLVSIDQDIAPAEVSKLLRQFRLTLIANFSVFTFHQADRGVDAVTWHQNKF